MNRKRDAAESHGIIHAQMRMERFSMTRLSKSFTTFEVEVEHRGVRYTLFAEVDVTERTITRFGLHGVCSHDSTRDIEVTDWSATDAGGHEITDRDLKAELRAELGLQLMAQRERILERV